MPAEIILPQIPRSTFGQIRKGASLAFKHRQAIKSGDFTVFIPAFAFALAKDSILDLVPIVGNALGLFVSVYLFIFLFGKGTWKVRLVIFALTAFEAIPVANLIPLQTLCVLYTYYQAKKKAEESQKELIGIEEAAAMAAYAQTRVNLRYLEMAQAQRAFADQAEARRLAERRAATAASEAMFRPVKTAPV